MSVSDGRRACQAADACVFSLGIMPGPDSTPLPLLGVNLGAPPSGSGAPPLSPRRGDDAERILLPGLSARGGKNLCSLQGGDIIPSIMKFKLQGTEESFKRNYEGKWLFTYDADYIISLKTNKDRAIISLFDTMEEEELDLTLIKYTEFYIELYAESDDGNFFLTLYPRSARGAIGIEMRTAEIFTKGESDENEPCDAGRFISMGDTFPDWIQGLWQGMVSSISFRIEKVKENELKIAAHHQITGAITLVSNGYIGHSGIFLTLSCKEWIDKPIPCELLFDYSNHSILYIEKMMLPARLCSHAPSEAGR